VSTVIRAEGLSKWYGNVLGLSDVSLEIQPGIFALLGPNGAGKSTTIGIICSLVRKSGGTVQVFGTDIDRDFSTARQNLGLVPQEFNFQQFEKVMDILVTQAGYYGLPRRLALTRSEKYLRLLVIARALVHEPRLLILDEPTAGVDIELRRSTWQFLRDLNADGTTIILTTHYLEEAESLCNRIAIIDQGRIVENTSMRALLAKLNTEVFVLDTRERLDRFPDLPGYAGRLIDGHSLEVEVEKSRSLNELFASLAAQQIHVVSMRNKANRLEELFVSLVGASGAGGSQG